MIEHLPRPSLSWRRFPSLSPLRSRRTAPSWPALALVAIAGGVFGGLAVWLFEPRLGRHRRAELKDRAAAGVEHMLYDGRGSLAHGSAVLRGNLAGLHPFGRGRIALNDAALADKVRSELFADAQVPKGDIIINAEHGRIVLRGEVDDEQIEMIERKVRRIPGVDGVDNLLRARAVSIAVD